MLLRKWQSRDLKELGLSLQSVILGKKGKSFTI
jgi:hypothetical protein